MLEHIPDDISAMKELHRILKPTAKGILVVPILEGLAEVYEDLNIITEEERLLNFGQEDHVRMYNKEGYITRLKNVGFKVKEYTVKDFSKEIFTQVAISHKSVLYVVEK
jgi:predicted SAM-dependent methyltransferase